MVRRRHAYPSGDGTAGGAFRFAFNVLPGDVNQSGGVLADDYSAVKKKFFKDTADATSTDASYSPLHDVDGSGVILANDFSEVKKRFFDSLPPAAASAARRHCLRAGASGRQRRSSRKHLHPATKHRADSPACRCHTPSCPVPVYLIFARPRIA